MVFAFESERPSAQQMPTGSPDGGVKINVEPPMPKGPDRFLERESRAGRPAFGLGMATSPAVRIPSQSPARFATTTNGAEPKLDFEKLKKKAAKKKKKQQQQQRIGAVAPAVQTVRGFQTPPVTSGGEDFSDMSTAASTPRLGPKMLSSVTSSPALRPSTSSGISTLTTRLEALSMHASPGLMPFTSPSRSASRSRILTPTPPSESSEGEKMESYEIPLNLPFVNPEIATKSTTPTMVTEMRDSVVRKMTAADFEPLLCLGKGGFGTVLLVKQRATGRLYAQKQFKKASLVVHKRLVEQTKTERAILESVNRHPFVVKLFYAFQDHEKLYLILEYAEGGELFHHLALERLFPEDTAAFYLAELVLALDHLHRTVGVVYRDLKPENCLLDHEGHLLLTDFGLSKVAVDGDDRCNSFLGTIDYMAPEVIERKEYGMAVDWWSLGALGFDLLTGNPPFAAPNNKKIQEKILKGKLQMPYFLSPDSKDLLTRLLRKDPRKRLGGNMPKDMVALKGHRFFRKIDWVKLTRREMEPPIRPVVTDPELAENFAHEFTHAPVSPVVSRDDGPGVGMDVGDEGGVPVQDPFGGFSFVASSSLLEDGWLI
ncbi:kinase-like protein [Trichodelitschia bisporula]|uniref:Kinase-like protein n=1 Tax=Trichodelitschia bisporula TaxID=703511 RepID=A0A6G1HJS5_9PEZI|nr:kinase-like protein [Trichodelitschia bisporula]